MRLFEAIIDANHRALAGESRVGLHPADHASALPVAALTCIDVRLNRLLPSVLGVAEEDFIWLRNAGNIITQSLSSTMRSLALACTVKGAKEIAVIGHTDCRVRQVTVMELVARFEAMGIERARLPENLTEFFGLFASENQNVIQAVDRIRASPIIGPKIPVHGLLVDIQSGKLDWLVNGYQVLDLSSLAAPSVAMPRLKEAAEESVQAAQEMASEATKAATAKIGGISGEALKWLAAVKMPSMASLESKIADQLGLPPEVGAEAANPISARVPLPKPPTIKPAAIPVPPRLHSLPRSPKGR
jgi:carbonic anhydrase